MGNTLELTKNIIYNNRKNLIALSGNIYGIIPQLILNQGIDKAEEELKWWLDTFKEDFYLEINRHGLDEEEHLNEVLTDFSKKYNVKNNSCK